MNDVVTPDSIRKVAEFAARVAIAESLLTTIRALHGRSAYGKCIQCNTTFGQCATIRVMNEVMKAK